MKSSENSKTTLHNIIEETGGWNLTGNPSDMRTFDLKTKILEVHRFTTSSLFQWYDIVTNMISRNLLPITTGSAITSCFFQFQFFGNFQSLF